MKRDFLTSLGLDKDIIDKIMTENGADIEREKSKAESALADLKTAKAALAKLESVGGNIEKLEEELKQYKQADADRIEAERVAREDEAITSVALAAIGDAEFVNEYTKTSILNDIKSELAKPESKGRGAKEIFELITKDKDGIFKNPNAPLGIPPVGNVQTSQITAEQFAKMGYLERVKVKTDNPKLYETLKS